MTSPSLSSGGETNVNDIVSSNPKSSRAVARSQSGAPGDSFPSNPHDPSRPSATPAHRFIPDDPGGPDENDWHGLDRSFEHQGRKVAQYEYASTAVGVCICVGAIILGYALIVAAL